MKRLSSATLAQLIASVALVSGAVLHFIDIDFGKYIFALGAAISIVLQLIQLIRKPGTGFREQRVQRMNFMVSLVLALAVYSMVEGSTLWVPAVLIYALVTLFLSFRS
ncbi:MAG: hypothetical protein PHU68_11290 [Paludibacter sp.]|jgi:multisubunit Na+/H+ antiporter MnhF subunit|nr:hypothetical protein [Paludibacter sp.]